jgi:hypothetical protein
VAADYRHVTNSGYNRDRGPVSIVSFQAHFEDAIPFDKFGGGIDAGAVTRVDPRRTVLLQFLKPAIARQSTSG